MNIFYDLVKIQGKIKKWFVILLVMFFVVVADVVAYFGANMGWIPYDESTAGTLIFVGLIFLPVVVIGIVGSRYIEYKTNFMNEYNNLFYVRALENQEGVQIKNITVTDAKEDAYESYTTKMYRHDREYRIYYKQAYLSISADISGVDAKIENVVRWSLSSENLGPFYNLIVRSGRATSKDVELVGTLENTNRLTYKIYIYHKKYAKKDYIKEIENYPAITTAIESVDKEYCIKTIDVDKANKLITDDIKAYIERIVDFKMPMCIIMDGDTIEFKIKSNNFKLYPKVTKKLDFDREVTRSEVVVSTFYELIKALNNHN